MKHTLILFIVCWLAGNPLFAQFDTADYKGQSNTEVINNLKIAVEQIERIERFSKVFSGDDDDKVETKDQLVPAFRLDTMLALQVFNEFKDTRFRLDQSFTHKGSEVSIDDGDFHGDLSGKTYRIELVPQRIYFYDGSSVAEGIGDIELNLSFPEKMPFSKRIDSISCLVKLRYVTAYDKVEVNTLKKEASYKGKFLKIVKTDKNDIAYIFHKDLDIDVIEGLNASGKVIDDRSQTTRDYRQKDFSVFYAMKKAFAQVIAAAEQDTSLSREAFQQKYIGRIEAEIGKIPDSDTLLTTARYHGFVKGLRAYIATGKKEQTASLTIRRASFDDIHFGTDAEGNIRLSDNNGKLIVTMKESVTPVNFYFYESDQSFLYFNAATKALEKLPYYAVTRLNSNYVLAQEDEKSTYILLNKKNEKIGTFDHAEAYENTVVVRKDKDVLIITPDNRQVWFRGLDRISEMHNGYAFVQLKGKYGFVDQYGSLAIPAIYDGAVPFGKMDGYMNEDLLFAVRKGDKWGFVDVHNKMVVPFMYEEVIPFSFGVTMVTKDGNRGLINTKNEVLAPFSGGTSYSMSTNFGKRTYSIGAGRYNHLGKKEKDGE